jgi:hypothetical protein
MLNLETLELDPDAARQYIDARAVFTSLERAVDEARSVRGGMVWVTSKGNQYLARTDTTGKQTGLGRRDERTEEIYARFHERKDRLEARVSSLKQEMAKHVRLNRALRVGRMPPVAVKVLQVLDAAGLGEMLRTVGTHAMFAYETAAGIRLPTQVMTTMDIDLLYDARRRIMFASRLGDEERSMVELLRRADKTFSRDESQLYTVSNDKGFQVDFLRREQQATDDHPIQLGGPAEEDVFVVQAPRAHALMEGPSFEEIVVASTGEMARMRTVDPRIFRDFKLWMSTLSDRDPIKRRRDRMQAEAVSELLVDRLVHLDSEDDSAEGDGIDGLAPT